MGDGHGGILPGCERNQRVLRERQARQGPQARASRQRRIIAPFGSAPSERPGSFTKASPLAIA
ncbi:hypothetical protein RGR602_PA00194 (plasmid) [Rhizobium gallicum bv. gallicum R602sp]|uniref:Uncharacterized protein n=1 Tax=Rhizobium gallicum bv. gallicum R602sp TaxID=1041138 RepID=A0A0B4XAA2_9HYPH|nr:hypothetical protein RGR602_PA00194 [Rhizobium gallicum bv. gallicum R602sp]